MIWQIKTCFSMYALASLMLKHERSIIIELKIMLTRVAFGKFFSKLFVIEYKKHALDLA